MEVRLKYPGSLFVHSTDSLRNYSTDFFDIISEIFQGSPQDISLSLLQELNAKDNSKNYYINSFKFFPKIL